MDSLLDTLRLILAADTMSYAVVAGLTLMACVMIKAMSSTAVALGLLPAIAFGGLAGIFAFRESGLYLSSDSDSNLVIAAAAGMAVAVVTMLVLIRIASAASRMRDPIIRGDRR
jgi:hypothetical protein